MLPADAFMAAAETEATQTEVEKIPLWPGEPPGSDVKDDFRPWIEPYLVDAEKARGAVLVCPGGGYGGRADHEAAPIAQRFNKGGLNAFVVHYRVAPHRHPAPLYDAARAVRLVRSRAEEWNVLSDHIAILGFSAGGHLVGSLATHFGDATPPKKDEIDALSARPDAVVMCYPVVSSGELGHRGSFNNLLGADASPEMLEYMSLEKQVTKDTPPIFLWHTATDEGVPVENSLMMAQALRNARVPFELHVYPEGQHGLGLAPDSPHVATWTELCLQWLYTMGWYQR
ncbi:MAG TPA: alpha/beta hydrolase [Candidatus Hydrogenedentes bacterium]|nr:alpha/beta hydrolase [Candidatus Hydrogenedentota bacterium]HPG69327.1 alpha/beta hydrolase [Candidatus Hydrogenedentota bacterium]